MSDAGAEARAREDLAFASLAELAPRIERGEVSPVALTEAVLKRIEELDGCLNAYLTVTADAARHAARAAEAQIMAGTYLGPLHGIPIALKDLFATRGVRTTGGSPLFADRVPDFDAAVVERLKRAGAVLIGKTGMHELAYGTTSDNAFFGRIGNPWNLDYHPGGSSGGSAAAVAAGLATAAMGSDTGCSIRQPAALTGIVGLKPTFGRVSKFGALPLAWSLDHVGPMARRVADCALMMNALAGSDRRDPSTVHRRVPDFAGELEGGVDGLRLALVRDYFFDDCDPEVAAEVVAAADTLADLGADIDEIVLPEMATLNAAAIIAIGAEAAACHARALRERPGEFSDEVRAALVLAGLYGGADYVQAQRVRRALAAETLAAMAGFDAVLTPTSPVPAMPFDATPPEHAPLRYRNCVVFNASGLPAISVPCGFTSGGLPIGLQISGHPFAEARVLRIAHAYEQASAWHRRRPPSPFSHG